MTITQLEYFAALCEQLNFTRVAEQFFVSQTAVTHQIKSLESQLGFTLFTRNKRHVELTAAGQIYYNEVKNILQRLNKAEQSAKLVQEGYSGTLNIGFLPGMEGSDLVKVIQNFLATYPNIQLEPYSGINKSLLEKLYNGLLDIVFTFYPNTPDPAFDYLPYRQLPHYALIHKKHFLSYHTVLHRSDIINETILIIRTAKDEMLHAFKKTGPAPQKIMLADNISALAMMLSANLGISVLPEYNMKLVSVLDVIQAIPMGDAYDTFPMCAVILKGNNDSCLSRFIEIAFQM